MNKNRYLKKFMVIVICLFINQTIKSVRLPHLAAKSGFFVAQCGVTYLAAKTTGFLGSLTQDIAHSKDTNNIAFEGLRFGGVLLSGGATTTAAMITVILATATGVTGVSVAEDIYKLSQGGNN